MDGNVRVPDESRNKAWKRIKAKLAATSFFSNPDGTLGAHIGSTTVFVRKTHDETEFAIHSSGMRVMIGPWPGSVKTLEWIRGEWEGDFDVPLKTVWPITNDIVPETLKHDLRCACVLGALSAPIKYAQAKISTYLGDPADAVFEQLFTRQRHNEQVARTLLEDVAGPNMSMAIIETMWLSNLRPIDVRTAFEAAEAKHGYHTLFNAHRVVMGNIPGAWSQLKRFMRRPTPDHRDVNFVRSAIKPHFSEFETLARHLGDPKVHMMLAEQIAAALAAKGADLRRRRRTKATAAGKSNPHAVGGDASANELGSP